MRTIFSKN